MNWNVVKIGFIDVESVRTEPIDEKRVEQEQINTGSPYALYFESFGPRGDGVLVQVHMQERRDDDKPLAEFYVPDDSWKTFVNAVNCIDKMWDSHSA